MAIYLTPGPSQMHPEMRGFLEDAWKEDILSISHKGPKFKEIYKRSMAAVRELMDVPDDYTLLYVTSATEAMERILQGVVTTRSHHFTNGAFNLRWQKIACQLGKVPTEVKVEPGEVFTPEQLEVPEDAELVCITHNETSTGALWPEKELRLAAGTPTAALVALDMVSSAPLEPAPWDVIDLAFFSIQKCFGCPSGLAVIIASPAALEKSEHLKKRGISIGSFHSLPELAANSAKLDTLETPNILANYLLMRTAEAMIKEGIGDVRRKNRERAAKIYGVLEKKGSDLVPLVKDKRWQSPTMVVAEVQGDRDSVVNKFRELGFIIGKGYHPFGAQQIRIANFPAVPDADFERLVKHLKQFEAAVR